MDTIERQLLALCDQPSAKQLAWMVASGMVLVVGFGGLAFGAYSHLAVVPATLVVTLSIGAVGGLAWLGWRRSRLDARGETPPASSSRLLYLRSFRGSERSRVVVASRATFTFDLAPFDGLVRVMLCAYGLPVAVVDQAPSLLLEGFARVNRTDDRWLRDAGEVMQACGAVVWRPDVANPRWAEIDALARANQLAKLIVLVESGDRGQRATFVATCLSRYTPNVPHASADQFASVVCLYGFHPARVHLVTNDSPREASLQAWRVALSTALDLVLDRKLGEAYLASEEPVARY